MLHSYITVIPKKGKDPQDPSTYRPIALLNTDLKIFTRLLANRLGTVLPNIVSKDQVGFLKFHRACDKTRQAVDLLEVIRLQEA